MKIFTVEDDVVENRAKVETFTLEGAGVKIPAIIIGEEGRGRSLGVLPVDLRADARADWERTGHVWINSALTASTRTGRPKLVQDSADAEDENKAIIVLRTSIGFRGGNTHTGDRSGKEEEYEYWGEKKMRPIFLPFPGEILVRGVIAQGAAGRAGHGEQLVAVMPSNTVFRAAYSGRLYGDPSAYYYIWRPGYSVSCVTWEERCLSDLF